MNSVPQMTNASSSTAILLMHATCLLMLPKATCQLLDLAENITGNMRGNYILEAGVSEQAGTDFERVASGITLTTRLAWSLTEIYPQFVLTNFFASAGFPERKEFERFAAGNKFWNPIKTILEVQWVPAVLNSNRSSFEAIQRQEISDFNIFSFTSAEDSEAVEEPVNAHAEYHPITYCSPPDRAVVGLNLLSDSIEGPLIRKIREHPGPTVTAPPFLLRGLPHNTEFRHGTTLYMPLFRNESSLTPEWTSDYMGCIVTVIQFRPLLVNVLQDLNLQNVDVFLFDVEVVNGTERYSYQAHFESPPESTSPHLTAAQVANLQPADITGDIMTTFNSQYDVQMADRTLRLKIRARPGSYDKDVEVKSWRPNARAMHTCTKMDQCTSVPQQTPAVLNIIDAQMRAISVRVMGFNGSFDCLPLNSRSCNASLVLNEEGLHIVEILADLQQISVSPVLVLTTKRLCSGSNFEADSQGHCICDKTSVSIGTSCVALAHLLPSIIVPATVLLAFVFYGLWKHRIAQEDALWRIDGKEVVVSNEVLGRGAHGEVIKAEYRGTPVAVKTFVWDNSSGTRRGSISSFERVLSTASTQQVSPVSCDLSSHRPASPELSCHRPASLEVPVSRDSGFSYGSDSLDLRHIRRSKSEGDKSRSSLQAGFAHFGKKNFQSDMKSLVAIRHPCIATLMGAAVLRLEGNKRLCLVMELMEFGSLWDLLHNETFILQRETALGMLRNITRGMQFLHESKPAVVHGKLKTSNVLVDSHFTAKICDFGFSSYDQRRDIEDARYWMAPECLYGQRSTIKSDVYSFGVVLYECLTRKDPFVGEDPKEVLELLATGERRLPVPPGCSLELAALLNESVDLNPDRRPPFSELWRRLSAMDPSRITSDVISAHDDSDSTRHNFTRKRGSMIAMAEKSSVSIMHSLFPRHVAEALMRGEKVNPERKEIITMYFSDIVGFTTISSTMSAEKVSDMLDRLYLRLDELADEHGVYKIETIGDAYLCATNIVSDQSDSHAARMARFSIAAMQAADSTLVDTEDPSKGTVKIRIGLHSGPCMASVVGRKNPKYTLFGDTINTASRMESNSIPGRIQCSQRTADLVRAQDPAVPLERRGKIEIKGKDLMETYWVLHNFGDHIVHTGAVDTPSIADGSGACTLVVAAC